MKRYYLSPVTGTGAEDDPYRPLAADYADNWNCTLPSDDKGAPAFPWTLVLVDAVDHAKLEAEPKLIALADYPLDRRISDLSAAKKTALRAVLAACGIDTSVVTNASKYADVVLRVGRTLDPTFRVHG